MDENSWPELLNLIQPADVSCIVLVSVLWERNSTSLDMPLKSKGIDNEIALFVQFVR